MRNLSRFEIIAELIVGMFRASLKQLPSDDELARMVSAWKSRLDENKIPDEDIKPLFDYALKVKNDMNSFSVSHMVKAWPDYVAINKTNHKQSKKDCPLCKGTGVRTVFNVSLMKEETKPCWKNHE